MKNRVVFRSFIPVFFPLCFNVQFLRCSSRFSGKWTLLVRYLFEIEILFRPLRLTYKGIAMKTIYILLTRSGTLLSKLVYAVTGASYTHASMAFDAELTCPSARRWIWARRPRWSASIPACGWSCCSAGPKVF